LGLRLGFLNSVGRAFGVSRGGGGVLSLLAPGEVFSALRFSVPKIDNGINIIGVRVKE